MICIYKGVSACLYRALRASSCGYLYVYISAWVSALLVLFATGNAKAFNLRDGEWFRLPRFFVYRRFIINPFFIVLPFSERERRKQIPLQNDERKITQILVVRPCADGLLAIGQCYY